MALAQRLITASLALTLVACGGTTNNQDAGSDTAAPPDTSVVTDASTSDSTMEQDVVRPDGTTMPDDVVTPTDGGAPATPQNLNLAPMGHDRLFGVAFAPDGTFFATGTIADTTDAMADHRTLLVKFTAAGQLDRSFGSNGFVTHNIVVGTSGEVARGIVVQPSGKVVIAATVEATGAMDMRDRNIALVRFNADGTLDPSFGTMGVVTLDLSVGAVSGTTFIADGQWGLAQYPDGRLVVTGTSRRAGGLDSDFATVRLSADGARDVTFGTMGVHTLDIDNLNATMRNPTILDDGSIVIAGYYTASDIVRPVLYKLAPAGALDPSFGNRGIYTEVVLNGITEAYAAARQGDAFVTTGYGRGPAPENIDWISLRINANGARDTSYGTMGVARFDYMGFNDNARTLAVLSDGRSLHVGGGRTSETNSDAMLMMITRDGAPDTSFAPAGRRVFDLGGASDFFWGVAINPAGTHAAIVGVKSVGTGMGNDDAVVLFQPLR